MTLTQEAAKPLISPSCISFTKPNSDRFDKIRIGEVGTLKKTVGTIESYIALIEQNGNKHWYDDNDTWNKGSAPNCIVVFYDG